MQGDRFSKALNLCVATAAKISGNIGSDLMFKIMRNRHLKMEMMAGIVGVVISKKAA